MDLKTCWDELGISPVRDKKTIKKAYAKKLKVTRPDTDPEGFKRLNTAYQACLDDLENDWYWEHIDDCTDKSCDDSTSKAPYTQSDVSHDINDTLESFEKSEPIDALSTRATYSAACIGEQNSFDDTAKEHVIVDRNKQDELMQQFHRLIWDMSDRNNLSIWQKVLDDDALLDISFKQEVSFFIIEQLLELRETQVKLRKSQYIPNSFILPSVMNYLSEFFDWHRNSEKIQQAFAFTQYKALYYFLNDLAESESFQDDSSGQRVSNYQLAKALNKQMSVESFFTAKRLLFLMIFLFSVQAVSHFNRLLQVQDEKYKENLNELFQNKTLLAKHGIYIDENGKIQIIDEKKVIESDSLTHEKTTK